MDNNRDNQGITVDLGHILCILWKKIWALLLSAAICGAAAYGYAAFFVTPMYTASFTAYINNRITTEVSDGASTSTGELTASMGLTYVYEQIIVSRSVLSEAINQCGYTTDYGTLRSAVDTEVSDDAPVLTVIVRMPDPTMAREFAQAIADVAPKHMARVVENSSMQLIDEPIQPTGPSEPVKSNYLIIGAVIGLALSVAVVIAVDMINDYVVSDRELEQRFGLSIMGSIPDFTQAARHNTRYYGKKV